MSSAEVFYRQSFVLYGIPNNRPDHPGSRANSNSRGQFSRCCMHFEQIKHCFIMYSRPPVATPCSQASLLSPQLAGYHIRPMGVASGPGVPTGVDVHPASEGCTLSTGRPPALASSRGGGAEVIGQRCHTAQGSSSAGCF